MLAAAELANNGFTLTNFGLVVFVTALGATLGKIIIYAGAKGFERRLQRNKNIRLLGRWIGKAGFYLTLFITALIPVLPLDDYVYIGAGANEARLEPMLGVTFLAKILKSAFEILLLFTGLLGISHEAYHLFGLSRLDTSIILSVALVALGVALYEMDWEGIVNWAERVFTRKPGPTGLSTSHTSP